LKSVFRIEFDVRDLDDGAVEDRPGITAGPAWARRPDTMRFVQRFGGEVVLGDEVDELAVKPKERAEDPVAQPDGVSDDRVEDRLHVRLGPADHPQDLAGGRLLLELKGTQTSVHAATR
jgi:hypothetical protein